MDKQELFSRALILIESMENTVVYEDNAQSSLQEKNRPDPAFSHQIVDSGCK
jgi:hypothetical protein